MALQICTTNSEIYVRAYTYILGESKLSNSHCKMSSVGLAPGFRDSLHLQKGESALFLHIFPETPSAAHAASYVLFHT